MGEVTGISWTDHTFNPWMGCTKVSPACDNCYAEALGKRTGKVQWGDNAVRVVTSDAYWKNPLKWNALAAAHGVQHRVFCASLADVFEDRPELDEVRGRLFEMIGQTPHLDWQLLTKRPENVLRMVPYGDTAATWPSNVWVGTTVEDQEHAYFRIGHLFEIPARVRFLSCEPLLGPLDLTRVVVIEESDHSVGVHLDALAGLYVGPDDKLPRGIDWVIVGGESGPKWRPLDLEHARSLRDQCEHAGVPFFFKQVGGRFPTSGGNELDGVTHHAFPDSRPLEQVATEDHDLHEARG